MTDLGKWATGSYRLAGEKVTKEGSSYDEEEVQDGETEKTQSIR